jgi:hypothetical protein
MISFDLVEDRLSFSEPPNTCSLDGTDKGKHVVPARIGLDEPKALRFIEPFRYVGLSLEQTYRMDSTWLLNEVPRNIYRAGFRACTCWAA